MLLGSWAPATAQDLESAKKKAEEAAAAFSEAELALEATSEEVESLSERSAAADRRVRDLSGSMSELAIEQYIQVGAGATVRADPNEQARADSILEVVRRDRLDTLEAYQRASDNRSDLADELGRRTREETALVAELDSTRDALFAELARLEELERQRKEAEERARKAEAAAAAARSQGRTVSGIAEAGSAGTTENSAGSAQTSLACPVAGSHTFIDSWGFARSGGRRHKGVDMMASNGTPVAAPVSGTVTHRSNRIGGQSFHLNGDDGHYYYGTHLSRYGAAGRVSAGTIIGYVGDTGNARGGAPHLHFEFHPNHGGAVNPFPLVNGVC